MDESDEQLTLNSACRRLALLRTVVIALLAGAVCVVHFGLAIHLPLVPMAVAILLLVLLNGFVYWRLCSGLLPTHGMVFAQLLVDVGVLTVLLYCAGGSSNPFVSFYLFPLVVTAVLLPRRHAAIMAVMTVACYSALMLWHIPLPTRLHQFWLHVIGMWCNFILSAGLIALFVAHMASALRRRERELAQAREQALRNEHIVALGTLAAGAAHELATPLSTMAVITHEMEMAEDVDAEQSAQLQCLSEQLTTCKAALGRLRNYSARQQAHVATADAWMQRLAEDWRLMRPATPLTYRWRGPRPAPRLRCDDGLGRTLANLINNAADASPEWVAMQGHAGACELIIEIRDAGAGVAADISARARDPGTTTKPDGHGLGLLLAKATVARFGGRLQWFDREEGGICTRMTLPLAALEAT